MSISEAMASPAKIAIGDKQHDAHPLTFQNLGAVEERVRSLILKASAIAADALPSKTGDALMERAFAKAATLSFFSDEVRSYLSSLPGTCAMVCMSIKGAVAEEGLHEIFLTRPDQYAEASRTVLRISGLIGKETPAGEAKPGEKAATG